MADDKHKHKQLPAKKDLETNADPKMTNQPHSSKHEIVLAGDPSPLNLEDFLPWACEQLQIDTPIVIKIIQEYHQSEKPMKKLVTGSTTAIEPIKSQELSKRNLSPTLNVDSIPISLTYGMCGSVIEVSIIGSPVVIPRNLIKLLTSINMYHNNWHKLTIRKGGLNYLCVHELSKMIFNSNLTQVILDDSMVREGNYDILLQQQSKLAHLSLCRCSINDIVVCKIANNLAYDRPGGKSLRVLDLSSNFISNDGAIALGNVLKRNRMLNSLNLSGNQISDEGAKAILDSTGLFLMKEDHIMEYKKRKMYAAASQLKKDANDAKLTNGTSELMNKKPRSKYVTLAISESNENRMKNDLDKEVTIKNGKFWCVGNLTLCNLNLEYNSISLLFLIKLLDVLKYQSTVTYYGGLIRVALGGNIFSYNCAEMKEIDKFLCSKYEDILIKLSAKRLPLKEFTTEYKVHEQAKTRHQHIFSKIDPK